MGWVAAAGVFLIFGVAGAGMCRNARLATRRAWEADERADLRQAEATVARKEADRLRAELGTLRGDAEMRSRAAGEAIAVASQGRVEALNRVNVAITYLTEAREFLEGNP